MERETHTHVWHGYLTWFIIGLEKDGERDTYTCMAWLPYLVYYWSRKRWRERHIQIYGMVTFTWFIIGLEKDGERDTYKCMAWLPYLVYYWSRKRWRERHIQMYGMVTFIWFIIGLEKRQRETHTGVHGMITLT